MQDRLGPVVPLVSASVACPACKESYRNCSCHSVGTQRENSSSQMSTESDARTEPLNADLGTGDFVQTLVSQAVQREKAGLPYPPRPVIGQLEFPTIEAAERHFGVLTENVGPIASASILSSLYPVGLQTPPKKKPLKRSLELELGQVSPSAGSSTRPKRAKKENTLISKELVHPTGSKGLRGFISYLVLVSRTSKSALGPLLSQVEESLDCALLSRPELIFQLDLYEFLHGRFM